MTHAFSDGAQTTIDGSAEPLISLIWMQGTNWGRMVRVPARLQEPTGWAVDRVKHLVARVNARYRLRSAMSVGRAYVYGAMEVRNEGGHLTVGDMVLFQGGPIRSQIVIAQGARLTIADGARFNYGFRIEAHHEVVIGGRCEVASRCLIVDQTGARSGPVVLEEDVWLAHGVVVMPGVRIGKGSVVSAGTVVESDIPPGSLVIGRPARRISLGAVTR